MPPVAELESVQRRLNATLARLAFEAGFELDGAIDHGTRGGGLEALEHAGINASAQFPIEDLEDEYAAHVRATAENDVEMRWRDLHNLGTQRLLLQAVIAWHLDPRGSLPEELIRARNAWVGAARRRAKAGELLLEARVRKFRAALKLLDDPHDRGRLHFNANPDGLDAGAANAHLDRAQDAGTAPELVREVCRAAEALALVEWGWKDREDWYDYDAMALARPISPVPDEDFDEWFESSLLPHLEAWSDRWGDDFRGWAEGAVGARPRADPVEAAATRIREVVNLVTTQSNVPRILIDALKVLREQAGDGLEMAIRGQYLTVEASPSDRIEVRAAVGRRLTLQLVLDDEPIGAAVPVSLNVLRSGVAQPLLDTLLEAL